MVSDKPVMKIEEFEKYVIPVLENKRESYSGLNKTIPWGYEGEKYRSLLNVFRNNFPPSKKQNKELEKKYPKYYFHYEYLEKQWNEKLDINSDDDSI